jgi:hypothetical protein
MTSANDSGRSIGLSPRHPDSPASHRPGGGRDPRLSSIAWGRASFHRGSAASASGARACGAIGPSRALGPGRGRGSIVDATRLPCDGPSMPPIPRMPIRAPTSLPRVSRLTARGLFGRPSARCARASRLTDRGRAPGADCRKAPAGQVAPARHRETCAVFSLHQGGRPGGRLAAGAQAPSPAQRVATIPGFGEQGKERSQSSSSPNRGLHNIRWRRGVGDRGARAPRTAQWEPGTLRYPDLGGCWTCWSAAQGWPCDLVPGDRRSSICFNRRLRS